MKFPGRFRLPFSTDTVRFQLLLIVLLGIVAYSNSFTVPLQYDDVAVLRKNINIPLNMGVNAGTRWVTDLTFSLNRLVHGELVAGYHAVNLAIHLSAALCLYYLVRSSMKALRTSFNLSTADEQYSFMQRFVPFATAAIFVCHPVQTQAVTYIAQRYTSLATLFYLASMLAYVNARIHCTGLKCWSWGAAALMMAVLAMMSKEIAFTLPLMAAVLEMSLFRGGLLKKPVFLVSVAALMLIIPLHLFHKFGVQGLDDIQRFIQVATVEAQKISRGDYFLTQLRVVVTYMRLLVLPVNQNLDYDYPFQISLFAPQVVASLMLHMSMAVFALLLFIRSGNSLEKGNSSVGSALRLAALGIVWFYLALSVESSVIPIRDVICEHRIYLPSAGFFLMIICLVAIVANRYHARATVWWLTACCCLILLIAAVARNRVWGSEISLWTDVVAKSPNKARANYHVGLHLAERSMPDRAVSYMVRAIELTPEAPDFWMTLNSVIPNLGKFDGRYDTGLKYQLMVYSVDPRFLVPWKAISYNNLGLAYEYSGNFWAARANFERAASTDPSLDLAWLNLAIISVKLRDQVGFATAIGRLQSINPVLAKSAASQLQPHLNAAQ